MRYKHYAPAGAVTLVEGQEAQVVAACHKLYQQAEAAGQRACILCFTEHIPQLAGCHVEALGSKERPERWRTGFLRCCVRWMNSKWKLFSAK